VIEDSSPAPPAPGENNGGVIQQKWAWHADSCNSTLKKGMLGMTKTLDVITEALAGSNHPFRKADNRPKKAQKHRYERRKIREYLHLGDWAPEEAA
jgi:hypothetical protein